MKRDAVNKTDVADFPLIYVMTNHNAGINSKKEVSFIHKYVSVSIILRCLFAPYFLLLCACERKRTTGINQLFLRFV